MKQKIIYIVFLVMGMYLPAISKECVPVFKQVIVKNILPASEKRAADEEISSLPASPFSKLLLRLCTCCGQNPRFNEKIVHKQIPNFHSKL
ncbi:MAG: hypothetical protein ABI813_07815 [Bacteroidota bacterium]